LYHQLTKLEPVTEQVMERLLAKMREFHEQTMAKIKINNEKFVTLRDYATNEK
jgi:hypothetical protein